MTTPDVNALIGEVAARHGITLRRDDPMFALVTVNQLVLEDTIAELAVRARQMTSEFDLAGERLQARVGNAIGTEVRRACLEIRRLLREELSSARGQNRQSVDDLRRGQSGSIVYHRRTALLFAATTVFALGVVVGRVWH